MRVIDPGHQYQLTFLDGKPEWVVADVLTFIKRMGSGYPGNTSEHPGTTLQEVLRACIDRVKYLDKQIPDIRNRDVISHLRTSIWLLEVRAAERHGRLDPFMTDIEINRIETYNTCPKCLHVGCAGGCHS